MDVDEAKERVDLRVGGGAEDVLPPLEWVAGRSPRGRRSLLPRQLAQIARGSISAWAEEPLLTPATSFLTRVDLRVGGGAY